jgi:hypothetical protein
LPSGGGHSTSGFGRGGAARRRDRARRAPTGGGGGHSEIVTLLEDARPVTPDKFLVQATSLTEQDFAAAKVDLLCCVLWFSNCLGRKEKQQGSGGHAWQWIIFPRGRDCERRPAGDRATLLSSSDLLIF